MTGKTMHLTEMQLLITTKLFLNLLGGFHMINIHAEKKRQQIEDINSTTPKFKRE